MNYLRTIEELEEIVRQLGIQIRYEKGDFDGGYCILKDQKVLVVNKRLHDMRKASILAQALFEIGIDSIFVKPALREFIEDEAAKAAKGK
ncbi:MAG: hypothetical protein ACHQQQ_00365 [Bacteroidota bacterium]